MMNIAKFFVSYELLRDLLHLPTDTDIYFVCDYSGNECVNGMFIFVRHPDLPESPADKTMTVKPRFRKQEPIVFEGWE